MPSIAEMRAVQKRTLHELLVVKKELDSLNVESASLDRYINITMAEMDAEDVAYVQKMVERLK